MRSNKLERLYMAYRRLMYYTAYKILQNESDAEDAVQAAFESILRNIDKIEKPDSPQARAYVTLTAEHKAINILRSRSGAAFEELDENVPVVPLPGDNGLANAMAQLPARYREVLLLRFHHGYGSREIAEILGIRQNSVQKLIQRARKELANILEKEGITL